VRVKLLLFLLAIAPFARADSQSFGGQWGGLNNADASISIGDNEAQDLLNVDITDSGFGIKKRDGYTQFKTIGTSTWGVRGGYYYTDTSGNKYIVHANNQSVFKSQNSGAYSAFITTDTAGTYYDFTDSQGYLYRATSDKDQFARYDGTTLTYYPSNPQGDQVEAMPDRLVTSGVTAYPNRVYFSGSADFTNFTTGLNDTDPFYEQFGLPGQKITAIKYALGRLFAWTGTTLSFWAGSTQFDGTIQDVTTNIGTTQPGSILYDNSIIYWQGQDKHFYSFDGNSIEKISKTISSSVNRFNGAESKSKNITTRGDFEEGSKTYTLTTTEAEGFVSFKGSPDTVDDFNDANITSSPVWFSTATSTIITPPSASLNYLVMHPETSQKLIVYTTAAIQYGAIVTVDIKNDDATSTLRPSIDLCQSTYSFTPTYSSGRIGCYTAVLSPFAGNTIVIYKDNTVLASSILSADLMPYGVWETVSFSQTRDGLLTISNSSGTLLSTTDTSYLAFGAYELSVVNAGIAAGSYSFDNIKKYDNWGIIYTANLPTGIGPIQWGQFNDSSSKTGNASIIYSLYSDSDTYTLPSHPLTYLSSQTITSGSIPTVSTGAYFVASALFARTASTETASLDSLYFSWNSGSFSRTYGTIDKNHRLMWSLAENNSTVNNATYIYDTRFSSWLKYSFALDAPVKVGDSIYYGGPSTGVVYNYPSGTNDNGSAITAYWKSKDFIGGDPFVEKDYKSYSLIAQTQTGSTLSLEYFLNGSASSTASTISLTNSLGLPLIRKNARLPNGVFGTFINFKFGNTLADSPFEVYSGKYEYAPRAWRVME
jgi:hypothetical protein